MAPYDSFAHGFYKLKTNINTNYVYLDFRDCQYANQSYTPWYSPTDFSLKYNGLTDEFSYKNSDATVYTPILAKDVVRIWDIKNGNPVTSCFVYYWSNCLVLIPSPDNHPRLIWGPYPESGITVQGYKIYRKYGVSAWQLRTTVSSSTYEYIDESVYISPRLAGTIVQYKITAVYDTNSETLPTNTVAVNVKGAEMEKIGIKNELSVNEFVLDQNHPNPFNPSTIINYSIKEAGLVKIKVYDILGSVVAELVNESKKVGNHSIEFDASNLPSGIYIYTLQVNEYSDSKKMLLLK